MNKVSREVKLQTKEGKEWGKRQQGWKKKEGRKLRTKRFAKERKPQRDKGEDRRIKTRKNNLDVRKGGSKLTRKRAALHLVAE